MLNLIKIFLVSELSKIGGIRLEVVQQSKVFGCSEKCNPRLFLNPLLRSTEKLALLEDQLFPMCICHRQ